MSKVTKLPAQRELRVYIQVNDFDRLQAKDRPLRPHWLKSYMRDLELPEYRAMTLTVRGLLADLVKLAGLHGNRIPSDAKWIGQQLGVPVHVVGKSLPTLHQLMFI